MGLIGGSTSRQSEQRRHDIQTASYQLCRRPKARYKLSLIVDNRRTKYAADETMRRDTEDVTAWDLILFLPCYGFQLAASLPFSFSFFLFFGRLLLSCPD